MLRDSFYRILSLEKTNASSFRATIAIDPEHAIFKGHFPQEAVVPGVCFLQIIKGLAEEQLGHSLQLQSIENVKFIAVMHPEKYKELNIQVNHENPGESPFQINSIISSGDVVFLKIINAVYI